ncbi:hypothetical protein [Thermococcus pacificus]|uniref:Uncharacterized protein n=1 Tax=Thermococcus pacificus TaxID=71998 RepID=A0A218P6F8_9EURY|nr:hypothetical protein [Thermococcus pacificus]ASJ06375.1 hypothetical protein A3L08_03020 [Thermococcus pacificus]
MKAEQIILYIREGQASIEVLSPGKAWQGVTELELPLGPFVALVAETLGTGLKRGEAVFRYTRAKNTLRMDLNRLKVEVSPKRAFRLKLQNGRYPRKFLAVLVVGTGDIYDYLPGILEKRRKYIRFELSADDGSRRVYTLSIA